MIEPLLADHLDYLRQRNLRPLSIRERRLTILRAARWFGHPVATVTRFELQAWRKDLLDRVGPRGAMTAAGQKNEIVHVSQFVRWCVANGHRDEDPTAVLVRPRIPERLPRPLGDAAIAHAMAQAEQPVRAWIALGAFCGLRCMEIASLAREDVIDGVEAPFLRIIGKGGKERIVPLPGAVVDQLVDAGLPTRGFLFSRLDGRPGPPSPMRVSERINDHLRDVSVAGTAHALRHRFGTKLYEATRDPFLVATVMGHASTDTTRGYVRISPTAASLPIEQISHLAAVITPR